MPADSSVTIDASVSEGVEQVKLSNGRVSALIIPALGGRIWELRDLARDKQWIWHAASSALRRPAPGAAYDDEWVGGWEELFPNDLLERFDGVDLPDHGEWWSRGWTWEEVETESGGRTVQMRLQCNVLRASCTKTVELRNGERSIRVSYEIVNEESRSIRFLFKQHLAVAVEGGQKIELPGGTVTPVDIAFGSLANKTPFQWPTGGDATGNPVDLSLVPDQSLQRREFVYVSDVPEGWCGVLDTGTGARLRMFFPLSAFPFIWFFMTYGGWRDHTTAVIEPCTNMPKSLSEACAAGQCASLGAGEKFVTEVRVELS